MQYLTFRVHFNAKDNDAKLLLSTAWLFKTAVHAVLDYAKTIDNLPLSMFQWEKLFKPLTTTVDYYAYKASAIRTVYEIWKSARSLGLTLRDVSLSDFLIIMNYSRRYPARGIRLVTPNMVKVVTYDYWGNKHNIQLHIYPSEKYAYLFQRIIEEREPYSTRINIDTWNVRNGTLYLHGILDVIVPLDFYYRHATKFRSNNGRLYGGVDINADRINLAIVDENGKLRDIKTFWFEDVARKGITHERARSIIGMRIHDMLKYAYYHGVGTIYLEDPNRLGWLKYMLLRNYRRGGRNYNFRRLIFRASTGEMIAMKAPLYAIKTIYVHPGGTTSSILHDTVMRKYGLDRHSASAYLVALKGLGRISV